MVFTTRVPEIFVFLCHLIYRLILMEHFRAVLLFNLDVSQVFSMGAAAKLKTLVLYSPETGFSVPMQSVARKASCVVGLGICHGAVGSFGSIVPPLGVIAVTVRKIAGEHLLRLIMFFLLLNGLNNFSFRITGGPCIFSILFHTAFLLGLEILNDCPLFFI